MYPMDALSYLKEARDTYGKGGKWERVWPILAGQMLRGGIQTLGPRMGSTGLEKMVESEFTGDETELGKVLATIGRLPLNHGEVFIVKQNMCDLIDGVWEAMPEQMLLPSDLPADEGVVFFEKPVILKEGATPIWGVTFCSASTSTFDKAIKGYLGEDQNAIALEKSRGCWIIPFHDKRHPSMPQHIVDETNPKARTLAQARKLIDNAPSMMLADVRMFEYGRPPATFRESPFGGRMWQRDPLMGRLVAFFALCRQELPATERFEPSAKEQKQLRRMDLRNTGVSVIMLRRVSGRGNRDTEVEWSHRWLVRGHWRNQYYPSEKTHRLIYINPHIKGPEDKPFVMHDKINILGR